jgi:CBS domain containing-hemolysin-like protein
LNVLAFAVALLLAIGATLSAILATALDRDRLTEDRNESISFLRLTLTGLFGIVVDQLFQPLGLDWWITALIAVLAVSVLLIGSQLLAKALAKTGFSEWSVKKTARLVNSLDLLFTPLAQPKAEQPDAFEQELLESVDEFGETIVREVMVPRIDMATVAADDNLENAMNQFLASGYSRLPVIRNNVDDVVGVLYLKDVTRILRSAPDSLGKATCESKARPAIFVPDSKPADDLLREMQRSATHIAIVVDEYGGVAGLVTMEDVIEEIVGEISDEYDREETEVQELGNDCLLVSAKYSLFDLGERFDLELEDEDVDSVGGMLSKELGRLPTKGDRVVISGLALIADRFEGRPKRLMTVRVEPTEDLREARKAFEESPDE